MDRCRPIGRVATSYIKEEPVIVVDINEDCYLVDIDTEEDILVQVRDPGEEFRVIVVIIED